MYTSDLVPPRDREIMPRLEVGEKFLVENRFGDDCINLVYSNMDGMIFGHCPSDSLDLV